MAKKFKLGDSVKCFKRDYNGKIICKKGFVLSTTTVHSKQTSHLNLSKFYYETTFEKSIFMTSYINEIKLSTCSVLLLEKREKIKNDFYTF